MAGIPSQDQPINTMAGAAPPPMQGGPFDQMSMEDIIRQQLPLITQGEQGVARAAQSVPQATAPVVKTGLQDEPWMKMQPVRGQGFGHGLLNLIADLGRGALTTLASTGPGEAVQESVYGPGIRRREQEKQNIATQIEESKTAGGLSGEEAKVGAETVGGIGGALYKQGMLGIGQEKVQVAKQRADQAATKIANDYKVQLQRLEQGAQRLDIQAQQQQVREWYSRGLLDAYNARTAAGMDENSARIGANEDMKAAAQESTWRNQHWFQNMLGIEPPGATVSAPGARPPKPTGVQQPNAKPAGKAGPPAGATHIGVGPDGKKHYADAKGNDLGLVR
jgi:hypothetical protein